MQQLEKTGNSTGLQLIATATAVAVELSCGRLQLQLQGLCRSWQLQKNQLQLVATDSPGVFWVTESIGDISLTIECETDFLQPFENPVEERRVDQLWMRFCTFQLCFLGVYELSNPLVASV